MSTVHGYPSIRNLGHRLVADILREPVVVQEKVDGSQISFGVRLMEDKPPEWQELFIRSKGADIRPDTTDKLFRPAVNTIERLFAGGLMTPGYTYRGEAFSRPKHNTLPYDRVPVGNIVLFDVDTGEEAYQTADLVAICAQNFGLEPVPTLYQGMVTDLNQLRALLARVSVLGGCTVEGVVIKAYGRYTAEGKTLMAKYVSEAFKESHRTDWRLRNPTRNDVVERLIAQYQSPARWAKAVQHLREAGRLLEAPQDIGPLITEVGRDVEAEERDIVVKVLYDHFWPQIRRGITKGLPDWYKEQLAKAAFPADAVTLTDIADPRPERSPDVGGEA